MLLVNTCYHVLKSTTILVFLMAYGLMAAYVVISNRYMCSVLSNAFQWQTIIKPQYVEHIAKSVEGTVGDKLNKIDKRQAKDTLCDILDLNQVMDRNVSDLSGGELHRFAIAARAMEDADVYMFDEPSCYLDVKQRLKAAQVIRSLLQPKK